MDADNQRHGARGVRKVDAKEFEYPDSPDVACPVATRRECCEWVTRAAAGLIGLGLAVPLVGDVSALALKRRAQLWVDIAAVDKLPVYAPWFALSLGWNRPNSQVLLPWQLGMRQRSRGPFCLFIRPPEGSA